MKKLLLSIFVMSALSSMAQVPAVDSLKKVLTNNSLPEQTRIDVLNRLADLKKTDLGSSFEYAREALDRSRKTGYKRGEGWAAILIGNYYISRFDTRNSLDYSLLAMRIFESLNEKEGLRDAYMVAALTYMNLRETDKAEKYLNLTLPLALELKNDEAIARSYNNLGYVALERKNRKEALQLFLKGLDNVREPGHYPTTVNLLCNVCKMYVLDHDPHGGLPYAKKALGVAQAIDDKSKQALALFNIGLAYMRMDSITQAEKHLLMSEKVAKKSGEKTNLFAIYYGLIELKTITEKNIEAHEYQVKYYKVKDSIFTREKAQQIAEMEAKYETEKKEQEIALLEQQNRNQVQWRNSLVGGLFLVVVAAMVIYLLQRSRAAKTRQLLVTEQLLVQQLQAADQLKSRFFANISHEFRTPLTLILSPVDEKLRARELPQKEQIFLQSVRRGANRVLELINQVLELSKLESGFMKLQRQPGNLHHFIMPVLSSFDSLAEVNHTTFVREVQITETIVLFDGDKLEKILNNLLSNAFKFSVEGGRIEVNVTGTDDGQSLAFALRVKNTGPVIPPDTLERIFEPFFQGETAPMRGVHGTGLGLSLVKELVKLHHGHIEVTSNDTEGTVFIVTLMFEKSPAPDTTPSAKEKTVGVESVASENTPAETTADKETLLIVEDNHDVCKLIRQGLENHYNIMEASTGKAGLELAQAHHVHLVVSDVMMPLMNGIEFCQRLKNNELTSHIPVILLTARADHESKLEGLRTGADDYVVKPFNLQELHARVANLIEQRKRLVKKYNQQVVVQPHEIAVTPLDERFIQKAIRVIEDNLDNPELNVDKMSEALGMSRTNLHRKLKSVAGLATAEFIQDFRLRRAAQLIAKRADNISQIAYQVGFTDQSYFTKCFRKKFGKTPSELGQAQGEPTTSQP